MNEKREIIGDYLKTNVEGNRYRTHQRVYSKFFHVFV